MIYGFFKEAYILFKVFSPVTTDQFHMVWRFGLGFSFFPVFRI